MSEHLSHESTAWNLALGLGMLWTAFRPRATVGMLPVMTGFLFVLAGFSAHDLASGAVSVTRIASHGLLVAGLVLLAVVHRQHRRGPTPESSDRDSVPGADISTTGARPLGSRDARDDGQQPPLRPASHHKAA
jgi:predicted anti-sigma-YlaC factor YlaD